MGGGCNVGVIEVVGGGGCKMKNFDGVGGGSSHVGTIEVVEGGGIERIKFRRAGGYGVGNLDSFEVRRLSSIVVILFGLGEENLVLLSSSNSTGWIRCCWEILNTGKSSFRMV